MKILPLLCVLHISCASAYSPVIDRASHLPPTARYVQTEGEEMREEMAALAETLRRGGYTIHTMPGLQMFGFHDGATKTIVLNADVPLNTQFETLAHEAGHAFHAPSLSAYSYPTAEVFAELVGNRVQVFYGSRTAVQTSSDYLAAFKWAFTTVPYLRRDMDRAVRVLTNQEPW